jgi:hypothetical protein
MAIDSIVKQLAENSLSDTEKLKLITDLETSIRRKKEESDLLGEAAKQIANRIKTTEKLFKQSVEEMRQIAKVPGPVGPQGKEGKQGRDGLPGQNGRDGHNGSDGRDGVDGQDGVSVEDAYFTADGSLLLVLSDGREIDAGNPMGLSSRAAGATITQIQQAGTETLAETFVRYTFEVVSKNLDSADGDLSYNEDGDLILISYANGIDKTLAYTAGGDLDSLTLSGDTPEGIMLTKTFTYNAGGDLIAFVYS